MIIVLNFLIYLKTRLFLKIPSPQAPDINQYQKAN